MEGNKPMNHALLLRLKDARYKILVACRPLAPAKTAYNLTLQAIIDAGKVNKDTTDEEINCLKSLMLDE